MKIEKSKTEKTFVAAMNLVNVSAAALGFFDAIVGFHFYTMLDLPQGIDDMEHMILGGLVLGVFGTIVTFMTLGGAYWLNNGSKRFKIGFCAVFAFITYAIIYLRNVLPEIEKTVDDGIMAEFDRYYMYHHSRQIVDACQRNHKCCGYFGFRDFQAHRTLPESCCSERDRRKYGSCTRKIAYTDPCRHKLAGMMNTYFKSMDVFCYLTASTLIALVFIVQMVEQIFNDKTLLDKRNRKKM